MNWIFKQLIFFIHLSLFFSCFDSNSSSGNTSSANRVDDSISLIEKTSVQTDKKTYKQTNKYKDDTELKDNISTIVYIDSILDADDYRSKLKSRYLYFDRYLNYPHESKKLARYLIDYKVINSYDIKQEINNLNIRSAELLSVAIRNLFADSLGVNLEELLNSEIIYFPLDSFIYRSVTDIEKLNYNPNIFDFFNKEYEFIADSTDLMAVSNTYILKEPVVSDYDRLWRMKVDSIYNDVYQVRYEYEYDGRGVKYLLYDDTRRDYIEISEIVDMNNLNIIYKREFDLQLNAIISDLEMNLEIEEGHEPVDSSMHRLYSDGIDYFENITYDSTAVVEYYFTDSTLTILQGFNYGYPTLGYGIIAKFKMNEITLK